MEPAKPPLPAPNKRPFHPCAGSHTSNRIRESFVGRNSPTTRQNAGKSRRGPASAISTTPEVTASARVILVSARARFLRLPQSAPNNSEEDPRIKQANPHEIQRINMTPNLEPLYQTRGAAGVGKQRSLPNDAQKLRKKR